MTVGCGNCIRNGSSFEGYNIFKGKIFRLYMFPVLILCIKPCEVIIVERLPVTQKAKRNDVRQWLLTSVTTYVVRLMTIPF
jgi:hypothetical protein